MGLQLIFVVETNIKNKSDWIYIKDTIENFYQYDQAHTKFTPVYMDGKGKYKNKEKEIRAVISQYAHSNKKNQSKVIYCFDCDEYDVNPIDANFLKEVKQYCDTKNADFVWFCKDIEQVYLGRKVTDKQKKKEAEVFKKQKIISKLNASKLLAKSYIANTSNIMCVLDKYLSRK